ncbi:hypothetical protein DRE_04810 [Drechslerella stenobrocha 248]|uniref:Nudix hydrolase domain-containing protein n=1 Tax=Drechslerella stenobrocha 248 TaxID=1043628 RepID=W7I0M3_9PEZI|nr:hypothetical protein DRE_04810 [Drechslerella stenobrocha 248]
MANETESDSPNQLQDAINRLKNYKPPLNQWDDIDASRRAAVLILLFTDAKGELRVVLTERSSTLRTFAGQVALPGGKLCSRALLVHDTDETADSDPRPLIGKADTPAESAFETARREASEEIGLPSRNDLLPSPFTVTHLCEMPMNLSRNQLGVRPCVAFLHTKPGFLGASSTQNPEESLIPRLDPKEVASVFTVPLKAFLTSQYRNPEVDGIPETVIPESIVDIDFGSVPTGDTGWYEGQWLEWHGVKWRGHQFNVYTSPVVVQRATSTEVLEDEAQAYAAGSPNRVRRSGGGTHDKKLVKYKVWGMTARIVVDAARVAFGLDPDFEFVDKMGDDEVIALMIKQNKLGPRPKGVVEDSGRGGEATTVHRKGESGKL